MPFELHAPYQPTGDQPDAISQLVEGIQRGFRDQVLLGATGTGKTFTAHPGDGPQQNPGCPALR